MLINIFSFQTQQNQSSLGSLLNSYYEVKNALVNSDAPAAAAKAGQFIKVNNSLELKSVPDGKQNAFITIQKNLISDAERISTAKDLVKQREYFATFSQDFYSLAQIVKLSDNPVFHQYCPMKKMYWLSNESNIKNPYYGNAMLSCGQVTETIKP